jgi:hypothetical protein
MKNFALLMVSLCFSTGLQAGRTPDGITPARETTCDNLSGAAKGLCTAYCEAEDCAGLNADASIVSDLSKNNVKAKACAKLSAQFEKVVGHKPPCEIECPCIKDLSGSLESVIISWFNGIGVTDLNTLTGYCSYLGDIADPVTVYTYVYYQDAGTNNVLIDNGTLQGNFCNVRFFKDGVYNTYFHEGITNEQLKVCADEAKIFTEGILGFNCPVKLSIP